MTVQVFEPGGILQEMGFFTSPRFSMTISPEAAAIYKTEPRTSKCVSWSDDGDVCYEFIPSLSALTFTCYNHVGFGFFNDIRQGVVDPLTVENSIQESCHSVARSIQGMSFPLETQ